MIIKREKGGSSMAPDTSEMLDTSGGNSSPGSAQFS